jgi:hypothetical protein
MGASGLWDFQNCKISSATDKRFPEAFPVTMSTPDEPVPWFEQMLGADLFSGKSTPANEEDAGLSREAALAVVVMLLQLGLLSAQVLLADDPGRLSETLTGCSLGFFMTGTGLVVLARDSRTAGSEPDEGPAPEGLPSSAYWWTGSGAAVCFAAAGAGFAAGLGTFLA